MDQCSPVVPIRPRPVPFDDDEPPANLGLPNGTVEDMDTRIRQYEYEIAWRKQRRQEHDDAIEVQSAMLDALKATKLHRWTSRG
jgi:hypothetical protein